MKSERLKMIARTAASQTRELFPVYLSITFKGWAGVFRRSFKAGVAFLGRLTVMQYIFLIASVGIFVVSLLPWLAYSVRFIVGDVIEINSNFRVIFIFPSLTGPALLFLPLRRKIEMYYSTWAIVMLLYLAGYPFPNPIHTLMIDPTEYRFLHWMYVYGAFLLIAGFSAMGALRKRVFDFGFLFVSPEISGAESVARYPKKGIGKRK